jgi:3'-phosphoadenosine 5'-phosphosulfate sulfotransferase (PAPS reductase)/FAD synthetase
MSRKESNAELLDFAEYTHIIVSFSGGKDSIACVLKLLDLGLKDKIELWHQDVDGRGDQFMDWPCTDSYCSAFAKAFDLPILYQWRHGGFEREMNRLNEQSQPISFEDIDGTVITKDSSRSKFSTRRMYPQVTANLSQRWCSSALKIDVCTKAINNLDRLRNAKILLVTGERSEESSARSKYRNVELHKSNTKSRLVHQWRAIQDMTETEVWGLLEKHGVQPHPAYRMGFGRVSCAACIFGNEDQWATIKHIMPETFDKISGYEDEFGKTIHRKLPVITRAEAGTVYSHSDSVRELAMSDAYPEDEILTDNWVMPSGAYKHCGGPT